MKDYGQAKQKCEYYASWWKRKSFTPTWANRSLAKARSILSFWKCNGEGKSGFDLLIWKNIEKWTLAFINQFYHYILKYMHFFTK